ncbi:hypothetical protein [Vibrio mediterranei]|uniref:hypothetical protein n=1 Tax=Vibrio mediterranei TaxID=689 RepID=UPI002284FB2A|nr:hypothetical protein [Vibrio mediterranei]MCY9853873.1 hypothetical protein [Vibrio mediterranei]
MKKILLLISLFLSNSAIAVEHHWSNAAFCSGLYKLAGDTESENKTFSAATTMLQLLAEEKGESLDYEVRYNLVTYHQGYSAGYFKGKYENQPDKLAMPQIEASRLGCAYFGGK